MPNNPWDKEVRRREAYKRKMRNEKDRASKFAKDFADVKMFGLVIDMDDVKLDRILNDIGLDHEHLKYTKHECYPMWQNGVHIIRFNYRESQYKVTIDFIFNPTTGKFLRFFIEVQDDSSISS